MEARRPERRVRRADREHAIRLELQRVDGLFVAIYRKALAGDADAISAVLDLMAFRARLLRLDAPKKIEHVAARGRPSRRASLRCR